MPAAHTTSFISRHFLTRYASRSLGVALWLAVGGCSLVPAYQRPEVALAPAWDAAQGASIKPASGGPWWEEFHSAELNKLIARGFNQNYTLKAALSRIEEARSIAQVTGATQYPLLSLGGLPAQEHYLDAQDRQCLR